MLQWEAGVRSEVNSELNFPPKLRGARSRLYRRRFLQVSIRWNALDEIYQIYIIFAPPIAKFQQIFVKTFGVFNIRNAKKCILFSNFLT